MEWNCTRFWWKLRKRRIRVRAQREMHTFEALLRRISRLWWLLRWGKLSARTWFVLFYFINLLCLFYHSFVFNTRRFYSLSYNNIPAFVLFLSLQNTSLPLWFVFYCSSFSYIESTVCLFESLLVLRGIEQVVNQNRARYFFNFLTKLLLIF